MGGAVAAIEAGFFQDRIGASAYAAQLAIESKETVIVGTNRFTSDETFEMETMKVPDSIRQTQTERLDALRAGRDAEARRASDAGRRGRGARDGQPDAAHSGRRRGTRDGRRDREPAADRVGRVRGVEHSNARLGAAPRRAL